MLSTPVNRLKPSRVSVPRWRQFARLEASGHNHDAGTIGWRHISFSRGIMMLKLSPLGRCVRVPFYPLPQTRGRGLLCFSKSLGVRIRAQLLDMMHAQPASAYVQQGLNH